jgi:enoyl-CoA hydratase/carnithine racemase
MTASATNDILVDIRNHIAYVTFNRPHALNALTLDMLVTLRQRFDEFTNDDNVYAVISQGAGGRAYCAGGDVRGLYNSVTGIGERSHEKFFQIEYTLNYQLHRFLKNCGKPYLAMMNGIVMGGGMGVAQGATLRIVGERTKMAMPETKIGLFPDVGGTYFLSRATDAIGLYIGLTSNVINGADALHAKLADIYMTSDGEINFLSALGNHSWTQNHLGDIVQLAKSYTSAPPPSPLAARADTITRHFTYKSNVREIIEALQRESNPSEAAWAHEIAATIVARSPTLLEVTKRQIENGHTLTLAACLQLEYNMMMAVFDHPDVVEGIRALAIDKDNQPKWQPAHLQDVSADMVEAFFKPRFTPENHPLANLETQFG